MNGSMIVIVPLCALSVFDGNFFDRMERYHTKKHFRPIIPYFEINHHLGGKFTRKLEEQTLVMRNILQGNLGLLYTPARGRSGWPNLEGCSLGDTVCLLTFCSFWPSPSVLPLDFSGEVVKSLSNDLLTADSLGECSLNRSLSPINSVYDKKKINNSRMNNSHVSRCDDNFTHSNIQDGTLSYQETFVPIVQVVVNPR
jgi:hypothetical protein